MRKVLSVLVGMFITIPAFATGSATPTSKGYVDAQMDTLQDNLPGAAANTVLTTTNTAGETGTKAIYDASGNYAEQQDALVTAEDANTAIQMAIDGEWVCTEYDPTGQYCYVYSVTAYMPRNLLNPANIHQGTIYSASSYIGQVTDEHNRCYFDYIPVHAGDVVSLTSKSGTPPVDLRLWLYSAESESTYQQLLLGTSISVADNVGYKWTIPADGYIRGIWLQNAVFSPSDIVQPMLEISSTPHEYVPYKVYLPQGN